MSESTSQDSDAIEINSTPLTPTSSLSSSPASSSSPFPPRRHNSVGCSTGQINIKQQKFTKLSQSFSIPIQSASSDSSGIYFNQRGFFKSSGSLKDRSSWKESLTELSEKLQEICGSSGISQSCQSLSSSPSISLKCKPYTTSHEQFFNFSSADNLDQKLPKHDTSDQVLQGSCPETSFNLNVPFSPPATVSKFSKGNSNVSAKKILKRAESLIDSPHFNKQIAVRHFETPVKLNHQLAQITGLSNAKGGNGQIAKQNTKRRSYDIGKNITPAERIQEETYDDFNFLNLGLKNQSIDLLCRTEIEDLLVKIDKVKRKIIVESASMNILHANHKNDKFKEFNLESTLSPESCLCLLNKNESLTITQQSKDTVHIENFIAPNFHYLPVVKGDENNNGDYIISIHIPKCFHSDEIFVQTVDDKLFVLGKKTGEVKSFYAKNENHNLSHFKVILRLPSSVDSRSVSSYYTKNNQLIIKTFGFA